MNIVQMVMQLWGDRAWCFLEGFHSLYEGFWACLGNLSPDLDFVVQFNTKTPRSFAPLRLVIFRADSP